MSSIGSGDFPNPNDPNDPLHYAPRSVRSKASQQIRPVRPTSSRSGFDEMLQDAVAKPRPHPLDPEFVYQPVQPRSRFSVASRFTAAVGVVAIIGVIFFMMIPKSQETPPTGVPQTAPDDSKMLLQKFMQWQQKQQ